MHEFKFQLKDAVTKCTGDYHWDGVICAAFLTPEGNERYVVAHPVDKGSVLHIYGPNNLKPAEHKG